MTISPHPTQTVRGADLVQHYREVRARLMNFPVKVRSKPPVNMPLVIQEEPMESVPAAPDTVPLNMLATPSWRFLVALAAVRNGVTSDDILGPYRGKILVAARCDAMGLMFQHTPASLPRIGLCLNRDHTTVLHALRKIGRTTKLVDVPAMNKAGRPVKHQISSLQHRSKSKLDWQAASVFSPLSTVFTGNGHAALTQAQLGRDASS